MHIGSITLSSPTILAPLAGYTHLPFRVLVKELGCGLVCSEMISANGLIYGSPKTELMLATCDQEKPLSIQIFGSDPSIMAEAVRRVEDAGADIIDINMGCWVRKVIKTGAGAALLQTPRLAQAIIQAVRRAATVPLTVKMRGGWEADGKQAVTLAHIAEDCGVDAIAIHPRTVQQGFKGKADWSLIERLKKEIAIPVIGNGDVETPQDALNMFEQTGCNAVMVGRAALKNPMILAWIDDLRRGRPLKPMDLHTRFALMQRLIQLHVDHFGEKRACRMLRGRLGWFVKGLPHSAKFRESLSRVQTQDEVMDCIRKYAAWIEGQASDM